LRSKGEGSRDSGKPDASGGGDEESYVEPLSELWWRLRFRQVLAPFARRAMRPGSIR